MRRLLRVLTRTFLILVFAADEASAQSSVHVYETADAVLPCTYPEGSPPSDVAIYWRDKHDDQVLTIHNFKNDPRNQRPEYRNRVRSFQPQYKDGNFSLVLMNVTLSDAGMFECNILPDGFLQNVRLHVTRKPESGLSGLSGSEMETSGPSGGSSAASPHLLLLLHLPLLLLLRL